MKILGINSYHADSSCALLIDGHIISATEEERFTRIKHWAGVPVKSIKYCLNDSNLQIKDIDYIIVGRDFNAKMFQKIKYGIKNLFSNAEMIKHRIQSRKGSVNLEEELTKLFGSCPKIVHVEHHRCHLASAFFK